MQISWEAERNKDEPKKPGGHRVRGAAAVVPSARNVDGSVLPHMEKKTQNAVFRVPVPTSRKSWIILTKLKIGEPLDLNV